MEKFKFNLDGKKVVISGRFSRKQAEVSAKLEELGATIVKDLAQAHALVCGGGAKISLEAAVAAGALVVEKEAVKLLLEASKRPADEPEHHAWGRPFYQVMQLERLKLPEEPFARLRESIDEVPNLYTFRQIPEAIQALTGEEKRMAVEYVAPHVAAWPPTTRMMSGFSPTHPCWPLYGGIKMHYSDCPVHVDPESDWLHEALYALDEHPHIKVVDMYSRRLKPDAFHNCAYLTHVEADSCTFEDPAALLALERVDHLSLSNTSEDDYKRVLEQVAKLKSLRFLRISGWEYLGCWDFSALKQVTGFVWREAVMETLEGCEKLPHIEFLDLSDNPLYDLHGIEALTNLRSLSLSSCLNLEAEQIIEAVESLPSLECLYLNNVREFPSFDFLAALPNLKHLEISKQHKLTQLDMLAGASKLESICVEDCPHLRDIRGLEGKALRGVRFYTCKALRDLSPLQGSDALGSLQLYDLDLEKEEYLALEEYKRGRPYKWPSARSAFM